MHVKEGFLGGFVILGFVFFLIGFLAGLLSVTIIPLKLDANVEYMVFILGFLSGMGLTTLTLVAVKRRLGRHGAKQVHQTAEAAQ